VTDSTEKKPGKVTVVLRVPTLRAKRGQKVKVEPEVAERLIANNQAREA
jgi:hypothetical protein